MLQRKTKNRATTFRVILGAVSNAGNAPCLLCSLQSLPPGTKYQPERCGGTIRCINLNAYCCICFFFQVTFQDFLIWAEVTMPRPQRIQRPATRLRQRRRIRRRRRIQRPRRRKHRCGRSCRSKWCKRISTRGWEVQNWGVWMGKKWVFVVARFFEELPCT